MKVVIPQRVASRLPSWGGSLRGERLVALGMLVLAMVLCGCSSFERDWRKAGKQPTPTDLTGRWDGSWSSDANGHNGNLRCLITLEDEGKCKARFKATYAKVIRFTYSAHLNVHPHFDGWEFDGEENLGKLAGGVYFYEGRASATNFFSTYRSKCDHGVFEMRRPE